MQQSHANKAVVPFFQFPVLCLLGLLFGLDSESCKAQHEEKNKQTASLSVGQIDSNQNTVPYWQLPYNEQIKIAEPYHTYGNYTLRWQGGKPYFPPPQVFLNTPTALRLGYSVRGQKTWRVKNKLCGYRRLILHEPM